MKDPSPKWMRIDYSLMHKWSFVLKQIGPQNFWNDMVLSWTLWWNRNQKTFCDTALSVTALINRYYGNQVLIRNGQIIDSAKKNPIPSTLNTGNEEPTMPCIYMDGSYKNEMRAVGGVLKVENQVHLSWCNFFGTCSSVDYAEAMAIIDGIFKATQMNLQNVTNATDSLPLSIAVTRGQELRIDWWLKLDVCFHNFQNICISIEKSY